MRASFGKRVKVLKTLVTSHGYGTSPDGQEISLISKKVLKIALLLMIGNGYKNLMLFGDYSFNNGPTEGETLEKVAEELGDKINIFLEKRCVNSVQVVEQLQKILAKREFGKLVSVCWKPHAKRVQYTLNKICKPLGIKLEVIKVDAPFGNNSQKRLNYPLAWHFWNAIAWVGTILYFAKRDIKAALSR